MAVLNGDLFPIKEAFGKYLGEWYATVRGDTPGTHQFKVRGLGRSIQMAPGRMVDQAEAMIDSYRKNQNSAARDNGAILPVVIVAFAKDVIPTTGDRGGRQTSRTLVRLSDASDAPVYGYRQMMGDLRVQVAIFAQEEMSAKSLASQFIHYCGDVTKRRFYADYKFGQWSFQMPIMSETPDIYFQNVPVAEPNLTVLVADINLMVTVPYLDAPAEGEQNDGGSYDPPGYPVVVEVSILNQVVLSQTTVTLPPPPPPPGP